MRRHLHVFALIPVLAACGDKAPSQATLALACQTMKCVCEETGGSIISAKKTTEPLWKPNGDAYCQKGFALKRAKK